MKVYHFAIHGQVVPNCLGDLIDFKFFGLEVE